MRLPVTALAVLAVMVAAAPAGAALGDLDPTYGSGGIAAPAQAGLVVTDAALDDAGRVAFVGQQLQGRQVMVVFGRLAADGSGLDGPLLNVIAGVDGRLAPLPGGAWAVASTSNGTISLDRVPNDDKWGRSHLWSDYPKRIGALVGHGGDLYLAGWLPGQSDSAFVARFSGADGALVPAFDQDGHRDQGLFSTGRAITFDSAGRLVVAGGGAAMGVARMSADTGVLDKGFAGDGTTEIGPQGSWASAVAVLPSGQLRLAGGTSGAGALAGLLASGAPDMAAPFRTTPWATDLNDLALDGQGGLLAAGTTGSSSARDLVLARIDATGAPDPVFGARSPTPGVVTVSRAGDDSAAALLLDGSGRTYVAGGPSGPVVTRHLPNAPPAAALTGPATALTGSPVTFDASASSDPERALRRFQWDLDGDGAFETDTGTNATAGRAFPAAGVQTVRVLVTDHAGLVATAERRITVDDPVKPAQDDPVKPAQRPVPVVGRSVVVEVVSGTVLVRPAGSPKFVPLTSVLSIPVGSEIDARRGRVRLTVARNRSGAVSVAEAYLGRFRFTQSAGSNPLATLKLTGGNFKGCGPANPRTKVRIASVSKKKKSHRVVRRLWVDGKGAFRTAGRYAAATVRGTRWQTIDRCDGVDVRVASGVVRVRDILRGTKARDVRAGQHRFIPSAK